MFSRFLVLFLACCLSLAAPPSSQQPTAQAPQPLTLLQQSVIAMGASVPPDSVATGSITIVAGSETQTGKIRILTRGIDQSSEQITTSDGTSTTTYSQGWASSSDPNMPLTVDSLELSLSSQSALFPFPLISELLASSDWTYQFIGSESLNGVQCNHLQVWNTFASDISRQALSQFSLKDIWLDGKSGLPQQIAFGMKAERGAVPTTPVEVTFSDYRTVSGIAYPFSISKSLNGTPWATITIQAVTFNNGLTDSDFRLQ
jgi:hypothetical protein